MVTNMTKRGRPKLERQRYPSGQVRPADAGVTGTSWHRLRQLGTDPRIATEVGRLAYRGDISETESEVAVMIARIFGRHDRAIGARRFPASHDYEMGRGSGKIDHEDEWQAEFNAAAMDMWGDLKAAMEPIQPIVRAALIELAVEDRTLPPMMLPEVRRALDSLAAPLGLKRRRRA